MIRDDGQVTIGDVFNEVQDVKAEVAKLAPMVELHADHERRLRRMEQALWTGAGIASIGATIALMLKVTG